MQQYGARQTEVGDIAPGAEETVDVELKFAQRGRIQVLAVAQGTNIKSQTGIEINVRQPVLNAEIAAPSLIYHGSATDYVVTVRNTGDATATDVTHVLQLPANAKPVSLPYGAMLDGNRLTWRVPSLPSGTTQQYAFQIDLRGEGRNQLSFECRDELGNSASSNATTEVQAIADLQLLVSDPVAPAPVGTEVVYELEVTNRGSKAANNVNVVAQFSTGVEPTRGVGSGYRVVPGQIFFDPITTVEAGQSVKLRVYAVAEGDGTHRFRAEVNADGAETRLVQEESTKFLQQSVSRIATPTSSSVLR